MKNFKQYDILLFFKDCGRTRRQKGPQHGPSTIMRKNTIKKIKKKFKIFKNDMDGKSWACLQENLKC